MKLHTHALAFVLALIQTPSLLLLKTPPMGAQQTTEQQSEDKPRLILLDLEDGAVRVPAREIFGRDIEIGHGIRGMMAQRLRSSGYEIVEWEALDNFLTAQGWPPERRSDTDANNHLASLLEQRFDVVLSGSVTSFGRDIKMTGIVVDPEGRTAPLLSKDIHIARIEIQVINGESGEVLFVCDGSGQFSAAGKSAFRPYGADSLSGRGTDFESPDFAQTIAGKAIIETVEKAAACLTSTGVGQRRHRTAAETSVMRVEGKHVELGGGTRSGWKAGDRVEAQRLAQEIRDPVTQKVIRRLWEPVGTVELTVVGNDSASARIIAGEGIKPGDIIGVGKEPGSTPAKQLMAAMLVGKIEKQRTKGFDKDNVIQPSSANLRTGKTVFIHPMPHDLDLHLAKVLSIERLFEVVDNPRNADLWIRGTVRTGFQTKGSIEITPRGAGTVLWSGNSGSGGYDPSKDDEFSSMAKKLVKQLKKALAER